MLARPLATQSRGPRALRGDCGAPSAQPWLQRPSPRADGAAWRRTQHRLQTRWAMSETVDRALCLSVLGLALRNCKPKPGLVHRTDLGSQYASLDCQAALQAANQVSSMSRKGTCWDNTVAERFFATMKQELCHLRSVASRNETRRVVFRVRRSLLQPTRTSLLTRQQEPHRVRSHARELENRRLTRLSTKAEQLELACADDKVTTG